MIKNYMESTPAVYFKSIGLVQSVKAKEPPLVEPAETPVVAKEQPKPAAKPAAKPATKAAAKPKPAAKPVEEPEEKAEEPNEVDLKLEKEIEDDYQRNTKGVSLTREEEQRLRAIIRKYRETGKTVKLSDLAFEQDKTVNEVKQDLESLRQKGIIEWSSAGNIDYMLLAWRRSVAETYKSPVTAASTQPAAPAPKPVPAAPKPAPAPAVNTQEQEKESRRKVLKELIREKEKERDAITGLLGFMKKKKVQQEIDALYDKLRQI